jgi:hypothetical protein
VPWPGAVFTDALGEGSSGGGELEAPVEVALALGSAVALGAAVATLVGAADRGEDGDGRADGAAEIAAEGGGFTSPAGDGLLCSLYQATAPTTMMSTPAVTTSHRMTLLTCARA